MNCVAETHKWGLLMKPKETWDSELDYECVIEGLSDCGHATESHTRKRAFGHATKLTRMPVIIKSGKKNISSLQVTEGEKYVGVLYTQDVIYVMTIVESMKLNVKKHVKFHVDDKAAVDLERNCSSGGRTRRCDIKDHF